MGFKKVYIQIMCILLVLVIAFSVYTVMNREETPSVPVSTENRNEIGMGTEELPLDTETEDTESTEVGTSETEQTPPEVVTRVLYANEAVRVRSGPGTTYEALGRLQRGDEVTAIGEVVDGWQKILYNEQEAYVMAEYLSETLEQDEPTTPNQPNEPTPPEDPVDPNEPTDPVDPNEPTDPVDPNEPTDPVDPNEPTDPVDPNEPTDPVEPGDPVDPDEPVMPDEPMEPTV